jgi:preprotein translocase subunit YajC
VFISQAFAQTAPAASGGTESSLLSLLPIVLMFVVLYFIMIRPQMKRQKEHKTMVEALAKGDEVVTAGGMLGRVSKMGETTSKWPTASSCRCNARRSCRCCPRAR